MNTRNPLANFDRLFGEIHQDFARGLVGYDNIFDGLRNALGAYDSYPPYNIIKLDDTHYRVTLALAGFDEDDIEVTKEGDMLTIAGKVEKDESDDGPNYIYRGIATRAFTRKVQLASDIEVIDAEMENGMLNINLERIVPEEKQPRKIEINGSNAKKVKGKVVKDK